MLTKIGFIFGRKCKKNTKKSGMVELRICVGNKRKYISTGVKLLKREWFNGSVIGREDSKELNERLFIMKKRCDEIVTRMMDEGAFDLEAIPKMLKEELTQTRGTFLEYAKERAEGKYETLSEGTKKRYAVWFKFMEEWKGIVHFADVTKKNVRRLDEVLAKRGLKECSRWTYHKTLKVFVKMAVEDGLIKTNPYARMDISRGEESGLTKYLTPDEFRKFAKCEIPVKHLARVRDLFVFQTYTMMSYSDLASFKWEDCSKMKGQMVYKSTRTKTGQPFVVVLLKPALEILKRYGNKLPMVSNQKYNDFLKVAVCYAKIDKPVTTHWARHTGATLMLNEGKMPMHVVQHILGHASIRETEKTYAKVLDETIVDAMVNYENTANLTAGSEENLKRMRKKKGTTCMVIPIGVNQ